MFPDISTRSQYIFHQKLLCFAFDFSCENASQTRRFCAFCAHSSRASCSPFSLCFGAKVQWSHRNRRRRNAFLPHFSLSSNDEAAKSSLASRRESENFHYFCLWCRKLCFQGAQEPEKTNNDSNVKEFGIVDIKMRFLASRRSTQHKKHQQPRKIFSAHPRRGWQMKKAGKVSCKCACEVSRKKARFSAHKHLQTVWPALPISLNGNFPASRKLSCKTFLVSSQTRRTMEVFAWNACGVFDDDATFCTTACFVRRMCSF